MGLWTEAMKLIPNKYKDHVCIKSIPNGNCFFNSASLIVFGHENNNIQLRLAVMIELMANADHYLQQPVFEQDIFYKDEALDVVNMEKQNNLFKKAKEYISELKLMCKPYSWCSMVAFFGLASVLYRPVESLFPNTGNNLMNQIYNRIIMPRQSQQIYYPQCIIMWSSMRAPEYATFLLVNLPRINANSVQTNLMNMYVKLQLYIISVCWTFLLKIMFLYNELLENSISVREAL